MHDMHMVVLLWLVYIKIIDRAFIFGSEELESFRKLGILGGKVTGRDVSRNGRKRKTGNYWGFESKGIVYRALISKSRKEQVQ